MMVSNSKVLYEKQAIENKTYTVDEIAKLLSISTKTAYTLVKTGRFHYVKLGRSIRVSKESFDRWMENEH